MEKEMILGIVAGSGWGVFIGFLMGVAWLRGVVNEFIQDDDDE